jgi:hypothetical protein
MLESFDLGLDARALRVARRLQQPLGCKLEEQAPFMRVGGAFRDPQAGLSDLDLMLISVARVGEVSWCGQREYKG